MSELRETIARALFLHENPGNEDAWDSSSPEDRSPVWAGRADAVLASLPRQWGVRETETGQVLGADSRKIAEDVTLAKSTFTLVSWIETEPEEVDDV